MADTDPMLGDAQEQNAYVAQLTARLQEVADETRAARQAAAQSAPDPATVFTGTNGFGDSIRTL